MATKMAASRVTTVAVSKFLKKKPAKKPAKKVAKKPAGKNSDRPVWFPGAVSPPWLDGTLPGDRGCDPFNLSKPAEYLQFGLDALDQNKAANPSGNIIGAFKGKKEKVDRDSQLQPYDEVFGLARFRECEVIHGRWAMLAVLGIVSAEKATGLSWTEIGASEIDSVNYAGLELPFTIGQLTAIEVLLMGYIEVARNTTTDPELRCYPGGAFDPLNLADDPDRAFSLKEAEIKHSRLAMVAFLGTAVQALKTGDGALENLANIGK